MFSFIKRLFGAPSDLSPILSKGAKLLDMRTESGFKAGNISGSRNIPLDKLNSELQTVKNWNAPVITVCASGRRSAIARNILHTGGVEVYNGGSRLSVKNKYF